MQEYAQFTVAFLPYLPLRSLSPLLFSISFSLCFLSLLLCSSLLLCLLARKWVAEPLTMGNQQARWNKESSTGTSQQTQGKCNNFSSGISVGHAGELRGSALARVWMAEINSYSNFSLGGVGKAGLLALLFQSVIYRDHNVAHILYQRISKSAVRLV